MQDRLVKELVLARITTVAAADSYIRDVYIPAHNARFEVKAELEGTGFVAVSGIDLDEILRVQEEHQVGNDNTVAFNRSEARLREVQQGARDALAQVFRQPAPAGICGLMPDAIPALNAGSSSIKFGLFEVREESGLGLMSKGGIEGIGGKTHFSATDTAGSMLEDKRSRGKDAEYDATLGALLAWAEGHVQPDTFAAVGHRVVDGGCRFTDPVRPTSSSNWTR